jgi:hypothetical protein
LRCRRYASSEQRAAANRYNEKLAKNAAQAATNAAAVEMANRRERYQRLLASQRAAIGASGVTEEGSPLLVEMDSAEQAALDLARVRYSGELHSTAYTQEAQLEKFKTRAGRQGTYVRGAAYGASILADAYGGYAKNKSGRTQIAEDA